MSEKVEIVIALLSNNAFWAGYLSGFSVCFIWLLVEYRFGRLRHR